MEQLTEFLTSKISDYSQGLSQDELDFAVKYLSEYGYFDNLMTDHFDLQDALRRFQWLFDLNVDGVLDSKTVQAMTIKRCGCKDIPYERAIYRWNKPVRYFIEDVPKIDGKRDIEKLDYVVKKSFQAWQDICNFPSIERVMSKSQANFYIDTRTGRRNDFDGPSGTLAYATLGMTNQSICFFDGDENFTLEKSGGIKLLHVTTHEFGHSLGLSHSKVGAALMAPTYSSRIGTPQENDDIPRAQSIYGPAIQKPDPEPTPEPEPAPDPQPTPEGYQQIFLKGDIQDIQIPGYRIFKMS